MSAESKITPLIYVPPYEDLGPAMQECSEPERAFVIAKIEAGASNSEAARLAGYSASSVDTLKSAGYLLAHRERVQAALLEMSRKLMRTEGPKSIKTLVAIRDDIKGEPKDRIKCAVELLNRAGMATVQEAHLVVEHKLTPAQQDRRILELAKELGLNESEAKKMLVDQSNIIDADYEDVPPELSQEAANVAARERHARRRDMTPEEIAADKARIKAEQKINAKRKYEAAQEYAAAIADADPDLADLL